MNKTAFISAITERGFKTNSPKRYFRESLQIELQFIVVFGKYDLISINVSDGLLTYNTHSEDKALKLIDLIIKGEL
jgi:hypothetical protein